MNVLFSMMWFDRDADCALLDAAVIIMKMILKVLFWRTWKITRDRKNFTSSFKISRSCKTCDRNCG
jgi:hypothetical protein